MSAPLDRVTRTKKAYDESKRDASRRYEVFCEAVRAAVTDSGLSRREVADAAGLAWSRITQIVTGNDHAARKTHRAKIAELQKEVKRLEKGAKRGRRG